MTLLLGLVAIALQPSGLRPPKPIAERSWIVPDDYPYQRSQLERGRTSNPDPEGQTYINLVVTESGAVLRCDAFSSIRDKRATEGACAIIKRRARFEPALGTDGRPIAATYRNVITWVEDKRYFRSRVPDFVVTLRSYPRGVDIRTRAIVTVQVSPSGDVEACEPEEDDSIPHALASVLCPELHAGWRPPRIVDAGGGATAYVRSVEIAFEVASAPPN